MTTASNRMVQERFWAYFDAYRARNPRLGFDLGRQRRDMERQPAITKLEYRLPQWEVAVRFNVEAPRIEVDLTLGGLQAKPNFEDIEKQFGGTTGDLEMGSPKVNWCRQDGETESSINVRMDVDDPEDDSRWENHCCWLLPRAATLLRWARCTFER